MTAIAGERATWHRARDGDAEAFVALFDAHRDRVFHHALRLVGNLHDAEDVVAIAFLQLWRRRADVRVVGGSVAPWLLVTATNSAQNVSRSTRRYRQLLDALPRADPIPSAEVLLTEVGFDPELAAAVRQLGAVDRALVGLVVIDGMSLGEAAETIGIGTAAAKTRMYRIRKRLRASLAHTELAKETP